MNLNESLDASARRVGDKAALVFADPKGGADKTFSYIELRERVLRAAEAFSKKGIGRGDRVAIVHRNDPAFIIAYFGLLRLGAIAVPINFMIQNAEELRYMLDHAEAKGIVTQSDLLPGLLEARKQLPRLSFVWVTDSDHAPGSVGFFWKEVEAAEAVERGGEAHQNETVAILYTSGTTGVPKGVMMTHRNLVSNCASSAKTLEFTGDDVWMAVLPMFHTFCWTVCCVTPLTLGGTIVMAATVAPPKPWLEMMGRHKVSVLAAVPPVYVLLSKNEGLKQLINSGGLFQDLRVCISGAAPLSPQTHKDLKAAYGVDITEGYGLTETSPVATMNPIGNHRVGSIGKPIDGVLVRIVREDGAFLNAGGEGEIEIKGPNVMKGYFKNERATKEAVSEEGWFKSGDIGCFDEEGYVYIRDRKKDMIIVKGLKVFSAQVEKVLLGHPKIQEAAVVGIPDENGDERVKAFVVFKEGESVETGDLHAFCREHLDGYKRPRDFEVLDELPKNALKKTLKRVLRDRELKKRNSQLAAA